ncbi:exonuclease V a 5' deoxyribonuclease-domain-containing protein [Amanita rubescens]|nr:exonuclease V a 5' deoxyribonuclease-domain-containing protein [Amanita rubescens]
MSEDYYDYDSIEYSQEDLANIDAIAAAYFDPPLPQGCPEVRIELEGTLQPHESTPSTSRDNLEPSLLQTYRRNGVLTVTDLVSPIWCEVQFDYGLRQGRSRPLEARPKSFVSASGKSISVEKKVAEAVHKELELELGLKQVQVLTTSQEERWALRVLNFITGIEAILANGYTPIKRELPVFGVVHDQIIVGVIDEVKYHIYSNSKADLVSLPSDNTSQAHLDEYFICRSNPTEEKFNVLQLLDTKTRRTDSLPSPEDALPSRLQLMLYYRMLSDLVSESSPFDFSSLWDKLRLDSGQIFSAQREQLVWTDLVHLLRRTVEKLDLVGVNQRLQLVYRLQQSRAKKERNESRQNNVTPPVISQEERELSLAIEASLRDLEVRENLGESSHQNNSSCGRRPGLPVNAESSSDNGNASPPSINGNIEWKSYPVPSRHLQSLAQIIRMAMMAIPSAPTLLELENSITTKIF